MNHNFYFSLFKNCIAVKGAKRSTICDFQKGTYIFVTNSLAELLLESDKFTIKEILNKYPEIRENQLETLFNQLIAFDLGHYCENPRQFPKINPVFNSPYAIHDSIIELSDSNYAQISKILASITILGCQVLELRSYVDFPLEKVRNILSLLANTRLRSVEVYLKYSDSNAEFSYKNLMLEYPIVDTLVIHSAPVENQIHFGMSSIVYSTQQIFFSNCCGNISKENFQINLPFYLQGLKTNTCLYKKISIKTDGSIANCPSLEKNYGNIVNQSLEQVINNTEFKELWEISKDQIEVCKDCEFRFICSDCRAFLSNKNAKPKKCNYDPYTTNYITP